MAFVCRVVFLVSEKQAFPLFRIHLMVIAPSLFKALTSLHDGLWLQVSAPPLFKWALAVVCFKQGLHHALTCSVTLAGALVTFLCCLVLLDVQP